MGWLTGAAAMCVPLALASAQDDARGIVYLTLDNDIVAGSDDGYTGGFQIGYVSRYADSYAAATVPEAVGRLLDRLDLLGRPDAKRFVAYSLAMRIFTPEDITREDLVTDDLPYTGLLAFSATVATQDTVHLDAATLTVGTVGPAAGGASVQKRLHRATGSDQPQGWDNQIGNEPIVNLQYDHRWRAWTFASGAGTSGDAILSGSAAAGNMQSLASVGIGWRWGWNVPEDYFVPPPFFGQETVGSLSLPKHHGAGARRVLYLALGVDAVAIGNMIYLDGNTFRDSHRVDHRNWAAGTYLGLQGRVGQTVFALSLSQATVPWDKPGDHHWDQYGRVSLGWDM